MLLECSIIVGCMTGRIDVWATVFVKERSDNAPEIVSEGYSTVVWSKDLLDYEFGVEIMRLKGCLALERIAICLVVLQYT